MIRVAIVDDEELACTYLRRMLGAPGSGVEVAGHAYDLHEGHVLVERTCPQVVLLDVRLGRDRGLDLLATDLDVQPAPRILVLTGYPDDVSVLQALRMGAAGFVTKSIAPAHLISAVRLVAAGHQVLGPGLRQALDPPDPSAERTRVTGALSSRELDVLRRLGVGRSNGEIARDLDLSEGTVKGHVSAVMVKLGCDSRLQAGLLAQRTGV